MICDLVLQGVTANRSHALGGGEVASAHGLRVVELGDGVLSALTPLSFLLA
jgi:hypothetical protein